MKYENAKDILPASLLEELQKYAEGKAVYIPKREKTKGWGEASGYRDKLNKRNALICSRYAAGEGVMELAEKFFLSPESVKKIVYGKKISLPEYSPSVYSAAQYSNAGIGEEWVRIYMEKEGTEMPDESVFFLSELVRIPLRLIEEDDSEAEKETDFGRGNEAEENSTALVDDSVKEQEAFGSSKKSLADRNPVGSTNDTTQEKNLAACPDVPLIIVFVNHKFRVLCGMRLLALLRREKKNAHHAFVFVSNKEYSYYLINFGKQFQR
ncbi:MAG: hypothetical protein IJL07_08175 [Lachnospiraceae bacterium]|nr:hypothetical protein [Lachnospiraceae bacterium]